MKNPEHKVYTLIKVLLISLMASLFSACTYNDESSDEQSDATSSSQ